MSENKTIQSDVLNDGGLAVEKPDSKVVLDLKAVAEIDLVGDTTAQEAAGNTLQKELNGPKGLEPTRYGDWEAKGRCYDF